MSKRRGKRILHTELGKSITAAGHDAPYDIQAKRLIGIKDILGHIMADAIPICRDMDPEEAAACIESEVYIGRVPVDPGLTNAVIAEQSKGGRVEHAGNRRRRNRSGKRIIGLNTENAEINEGAVRHDILFYARLHGEMSRIMINIEIQKEMPTAYPILNRALYYACRMVSAQNERDYTDGHYGDIQRVYTIWLCMNERVNSLTHYHLQADHLMGMRKWPGNSDIINMIMIGISRELPEQNEQNRLHRLLNTLLSETMP